MKIKFGWHRLCSVVNGEVVLGYLYGGFTIVAHYKNFTGWIQLDPTYIELGYDLGDVD